MAKMSLHQLLRIKQVVFKDGTAEQQQEWNVAYAIPNTNRIEPHHLELCYSGTVTI